jgi:2-polyprenyl-3-methyl-5-hydroxy-6-metoxy-1,4-benzoquinol methylase
VKLDSVYDAWYKARGWRREVQELSLPRREVLRVLEPLPRGRLLEVGCCAGRLLEAMAGMGFEVVGADIAAGAVARCREKGLRAERVDVEEGINLGFYDVVVANDVLEHLFDPWHFVAECNRSLVRGGALILSTPNFGCWRDMPRYILGESPSEIQSREHVRYFSAGLLRNVISQQGFAVHRLHGTSRLGWVPDWISRRWAGTLMVVARKVGPPKYRTLAEWEGWV